MIGRQIGVYRIASLLGAGGMGQVYRARDTRLGRDVAIKVLPEAFASDPDRLLRFEHEAHVLASLNHPHIAAIYGFEECAGVRALVLELVEGLTLAEKLADGVPLPVPDALRIARQIAEGVEAAHAKGIVHRDLKPANIKVSSGGIAKVLDFGLAKAWIVDADACEMWTASTVTGHATRDGMILGTIGYMSPEQARGQRIDSKADIWAFGCVVFEMLAGRAAFAAETRSDSLARILERDPDWSALPAHTPARIRELLRRCLQKNPATRLGDLAEARTEIDASLASPFRNIQSVLQSVQWWVSRPMVSGALAAVVLIAAIAFVYRLRTVDAPLPQLANPIQVTSAVGVEAAPTFSPDARTIAYESKEAGNWDVWVAQVGGGPPANRTADHNGDDRYPSWSPDGRRIAFWSDRDGGGYYVIPAIGGAAARLIAASGTPFLHSAPEWSADGKRLAAVIYKGPEPRREAFIHIVSMIDRDVREISLTGTEEARLDLSWSPDARYFAYIDAAQPSAEVTELRVVQLSDGQSKALTDGRTNVRRPRWSADGHHLFYVSNRVGPPDLWRQRMADGSPAGEPQRVTTGLELREATFSNAGDRIAYSKGRWVANVWRVPILKDRPATWADAEQVTFDQAFIEFSTVSPDGRLLAYSSDRSGNQDVWVMPFNGEPVQLTNDPAPDWAPRWSYDGRQLAFIHIEQAIGRSG